MKPRHSQGRTVQEALRRRIRVKRGGQTGFRAKARAASGRQNPREDENPVFFPLLPKERFDYAAIIDPEGRVLASDPQLPTRLGTDLPSFLGANLYSFFPPEIAAIRRGAAVAVIESGEPLRYRDEHRPGRIYDTRLLPLFDRDGRVGSLAIFVTDVTSEKRSEEERRKLAAAIEQAVEAVIITDLDFHIEYVNQAFETMTGRARKETVGGDLNDVFKGRFQEEKFKRCVSLLANGEICSDRFLLVSKTGEGCVCDQSAAPVRARYGVVLGYVFVWRDATQVSRLEKQLRHAQKMEAVGALASGIAHDFNNILGPIMLHAELCLSKIAKDDPLRSSLPEILEAAKRAKSLADQLLHLGRGRERDAPFPFSLGSLVKECVKLIAPGLGPDITVKVRLESRCDQTLADPDQIHQVIMNLATNAAKAMEEFGGVLTFTVADAAVGGKGWSRHPALPAGPYVRLTVRDTGHGISPACLERIFEPFFSARSDDGTGLGLSVVQSIVARMGGAIEVESEPGLGSAFHVYLPGARLENAKPAARPALPSRRAARILFVDDDEATAGAVSAALKGLGHAVECRVSASEALATFLRRPEAYDLALIDLVMPQMNGLQLAEELLRERPDLPVALFSAYPDQVSPERLFQVGVRSFLAKPFDIKELDAAIRRVLSQSPDALDCEGEI